MLIDKYIDFSPTCRRMFELVAFLFPPFPRFKDPAQRGQFAVPPGRGSPHARHEIFRPQGRRLSHFLCVTRKKDLQYLQYYSHVHLFTKPNWLR